MFKKTAMGAVSALLAAIALSAQPNKGSGKEEAAASNKNPPIILAAPNSQDNSKANKPKPSSDPPAANTPIERPGWWAQSDWWLVVIAGLTGTMSRWQCYA